MAWRTVYGTNIEYPYAVAGGPYRGWSERDKHWVTHYQRLFNHAQSVEGELTRLRAENLKLQHENDFMLQLINNHMIGESK